MPQNEEPWMRARLELAEIKGMLSVSLQSHGERISATEDDINSIHSRVNILSGRVTTLDEHSKHSREDRTKLRADVEGINHRLQGQFGRSLQTLVGIVAVLGFIISLTTTMGI